MDSELQTFTIGYDSLLQNCSFDQIAQLRIFISQTVSQAKAKDENAIVEDIIFTGQDLSAALDSNSFTKEDINLILTILECQEEDKEVNINKLGQLCDNIEKELLVQENGAQLEINSEHQGNEKIDLNLGLLESKSAFESQVMISPNKSDISGDTHSKSETSFSKSSTSISGGHTLNSHIMDLTQKEVNSALQNLITATEEISQIVNPSKVISKCLLDATENLTNIHEQLSELSTKLSSKNNQFDIKQHEVNTLNLELRNNMELIQTIQGDNTQLVAENEQLKDTVAENMLKIEDLEKTLKDEKTKFSQTLTDITETNTELKKTLSKIEVKVKGHKNKSLWFWKHIDELKLENQELKDKLEGLSKKQESLEEEKLNQIKQSCIDTTKQNQDGEIEVLNKEINKLSDRLNQFKDENKELKELKFQIGLQLESKQSEVLTLENTISNLNNQIGDLESKLIEKQTEIDQVELKVQKLKIELAQVILAPREPINFERGRATLQNPKNLSFPQETEKLVEKRVRHRPATMVPKVNEVNIESLDSSAEELEESEVCDIRKTIIGLRKEAKVDKEEDALKKIGEIQNTNHRDSVRPTAGIIKSKSLNFSSEFSHN